MSFLAVTFYLTYSSNTGKQFLSLETSNEFQVCEVELQPLYGTFYADFLGRWSTNPLYSANNSVYELSFFGSIVDKQTYREVMKSFSHKLKLLGEKSTSRDFAWSGLAWSAFSARDASSRMKFVTNAQPNIILSDASLLADNNQHLCTIKPRITLSSDSTKIEVKYKIAFPPAETELNPHVEVMNDYDIMNATTFVSYDPRAQRDTDCNQVCSALPLNKLIPNECRRNVLASGPLISSNVDVKKVCPRGFNTKYFSYRASDPFLLDTATGSCFIPSDASKYLSCTTKFADMPHVGFPANFSILCPCVPAYVEPCPQLFRIAENMQYVYEKSPEEFPMRFDTRSIALATAVNFGIIKLADLQKVTYRSIDAIFRQWANNPHYPSINFYIDEKFAPMTPIICIDRFWLEQIVHSPIIGDPEYCLVINDGTGGQARLVLAYPTMMSTNALYEQCKCKNGAEKLAECNQLNTDLNLLFFKDQSTYTDILLSGYRLSTLLHQDPQNGDQDIMDKFHATISSPESRASLCPKGDCFVLSFQIAKDELTRFLPINKFGVDFALLSKKTYTVTKNTSLSLGAVLPTITCTNTIFQDQALELLSQEPPTDLTFPYYKCRTSNDAAIVGSLGSAAGITGLLASAVFGILVYLIVFCVNKFPRSCSSSAHAHGGRVISSAKVRTEERFIRMEKLLASLTELAVTSSQTDGSKRSAAYHRLLNHFEAMQRLGEKEDARPTSFDIASAYGDGSFVGFELSNTKEAQKNSMSEKGDGVVRSPLVRL